MRLILEGFEGTMKTTIATWLKTVFGNSTYLITEGARNCAPLVDDVTEFNRTDLSFFTLTYYMSGFELANTNDITHLVSDRSILSPVCYQALLNPEKEINIKKLRSYIVEFNKRHNRKYLYDIHILIKHPKNIAFIEDKVINDPFRIYFNSEPEKYKRDACVFETLQRKYFSEIPELAPKIIEIDAYPENKNIKAEILKIITGIALNTVEYQRKL